MLVGIASAIIITVPLFVFVPMIMFFLGLRRISELQVDIFIFTGFLLGVIGNVLYAIYYTIHGNLGQVAFFMAITVMDILWVIYLWKRIRKDKDRIRKALGAKSRALRDKLVRELKKLKPRPGLVPQPSPS